MKRRFNRQQRSTARLGVVQMVFAHHEDKPDLELEDIVSFFDQDWEKPDSRFLHDRFRSVCKNRISLEEKISQGLREGWALDRVDPVLCAILMVSTDEMLNSGGETPCEIIVKEYADLTADFFDTSETSFVNAYLNDLKSQLAREKEKNL